MEFNDTTNYEGVIQSCERYTGLGKDSISGDSDKLVEFTAYTNTALRKLWHFIFTSTGCWQYDDSGQSDLPQATANIVQSQTKYALPSDSLTVKRVEAKDSSGDWYVLRPITVSDIGSAVDEYFDTDGQPSYYRLVGETIELFPASDYNSTGGLKVYFDRGSVAFESTDTTDTVGIAGEYVDLVPLYASLEWLKINLPNDARTAQLKEDYAVGVQTLKDYYTRRFPAKKKVLRRKFETYK
jgi:hypothetical protein